MYTSTSGHIVQRNGAECSVMGSLNRNMTGNDVQTTLVTVTNKIDD